MHIARLMTQVEGFESFRSRHAGVNLAQMVRIGVEELPDAELFGISASEGSGLLTSRSSDRAVKELIAKVNEIVRRYPKWA